MTSGGESGNEGGATESPTPRRPALEDLAADVAASRIGLSQAKAQVEAIAPEQLQISLGEAHAALPNVLARHAADLPLRHAFLELATAGALKLGSALYYLNFAMNLGHLLCAELNEVRRGLELLERGFQQTTVLKLEPEEVAQVILEVADAYATYHNRMGPEYLEVATEAYRGALMMAQAAQPDPVILARAHAGLGLCLAEQWRGDQMVHAGEAIDHYEKALEHLDPQAQPSLYALVMHNLGNAHRHASEGDRIAHLQRGVACFETALTLREQLGEAQRFRFTCQVLAELEAELGHPWRAVELFERALETVDPIHQRGEFARLHSRMAACCRRAAGLTGETQKYLRSLAMACSVVACDASDPEEEVDSWAAATAGLAALRSLVGRQEEALELERDALERLDDERHGRRRALIALDYVQMLAAYVRRLAAKGEKERAQSAREKASQAVEWVHGGDLESHRLLLSEAELAAIDALLAPSGAECRAARRRQKELLHEALAQCPASTAGFERESLEGKLLGVLQELEDTAELIPLAERRLDRESAFLSTRPSLVDFYNFCEKQRRYWDLAVAAVLEAGDPNEAWWQADRCRARSLDLIATAIASRPRMGAVNAHEVGAGAYVPEQIRQRHAELVAEWQATLEDDDVDAGLRRDALAPWLRQSILEAARWRGQWVVGAGLREERFDPAELELTGAPTAIVEYWCGERRACAFVKLPGEDEARIVELPGLTTARQLDWIGRWFRLYGDFEERGAVALPAWAQLMERLSLEMGEACWGPLAELFHSRTIDRLILVPDLFMDAFPLPAMSIPGQGGPRRLCQRYDVSSCPSLRQLVRSRRRRGDLGVATLFVGDPQSECPTRECAGRCRLALPMAENELKALRARWPEVQVLIGRECTPRTVLDRLTELRPGLVHLSTHGWTRFDDPLASGFLLSCEGEPGDDPLALYLNHDLNPSWGTGVSGEVLTLDTILRRADLSACRLAVLNACEVGLSYVGRPRESLSLAGAFLAAGVATVVAPLWPISEATASLLAGRFYAELQSTPQQKLRALMAAQRWLREVRYDEVADRLTARQMAAATLLSGRERPFSHPFFWAPFQLLGDPD